MKYHVSQSVRGAILATDQELEGWVKDDNGRLMTPLQARNVFMDMLADGVEFISHGDCDNFDPKRGCLGHEEGGEA